MWLAVMCAVAGAFFLAFGAQRQGSAVQNNTGGLALGGSGFVRLLRNPRWVLGLLLLGAGTILNVVALPATQAVMDTTVARFSRMP